MGLLDDAIREHLELKRRHGAQETEVQRLAEEVFGAEGAEGARVPEEPAAAAPEPPVTAEEPAAAAPAPEESAAPEPPVTAEEPAVAAAPVPDPEPAEAEPPPARPALDSEDWYDEPDEVPFEDSLDHTRGRAQETKEFTADEAREALGEEPSDVVAPDEEPGEDLLEETPDFLQETPEHDRLWFEQRPPRDFDFGS